MYEQNWILLKLRTFDCDAANFHQFLILARHKRYEAMSEDLGLSKSTNASSAWAKLSLLHLVPFFIQPSVRHEQQSIAELLSAPEAPVTLFQTLLSRQRSPFRAECTWSETAGTDNLLQRAQEKSLIDVKGGKKADRIDANCEWVTNDTTTQQTLLMAFCEFCSFKSTKYSVYTQTALVFLCQQIWHWKMSNFVIWHFFSYLMKIRKKIPIKPSLNFVLIQQSDVNIHW